MATFLHLSDLHAVGHGDLCSGVLDTRAILIGAIDRLIDKGEAFGPLDAVLVTGDVSEDGSPDSYDFARTQLERFALPIYVVPGNHDARKPMQEAFSGLGIMPPDGLVDWADTVGDTRVIGLDTLVEGQGGGRLRRESLDLLERELSGFDGPVVVMLHHPPFSIGIDFMDVIGLENRSDLAEILSMHSGDITVLAGHVHGVHIGRVGGHVAMTAPGLCSGFALDRRAVAPAGFFSGPTGCAVLETGKSGIWSVVSLDAAEGPYSF